MDIWWADARDAAKHPVILETFPIIKNKIKSIGSPVVNRACSDVSFTSLITPLCPHRLRSKCARSLDWRTQHLPPTTGQRPPQVTLPLDWTLMNEESSVTRVLSLLFLSRGSYAFVKPCVGSGAAWIPLSDWLCVLLAADQRLFGGPAPSPLTTCSPTVLSKLVSADKEKPE